MNKTEPQLLVEASHLEDLPTVARMIQENCHATRIFAVEGEMGSGKTTFISAFCQVLGCVDHISSPSFSIVNEYAWIRPGEAPKKIFHFDFYRTEHIAEAMDIGISGYLESGNICFIEWPQVVAALLPPETMLIHIQVRADGIRNFSVFPLFSRY